MGHQKNDTWLDNIEMPAHRQERLREILASIAPGQKRIAIKKWHQILGELRSMTIAIPGARGMFSLLQEAFRHNVDGRLRLNQGVHDTITDFRWLSDDIQRRPTRLHEIIPQSEPELLGAGDACGLGMGGVWFPMTDRLQPRKDIHTCDGAPPSTMDGAPLQLGTALPPLVWQAKFPQEITERLVTEANPTGDITNSHLELAASLVQRDVTAQYFDVRERTIANGSDNTPTVAWRRKGSTTTTSAAAHLLRAQALHQRYHRYPATDFLIRLLDTSYAADDPHRVTLAVCHTPT